MNSAWKLCTVEENDSKTFKRDENEHLKGHITLFSRKTSVEDETLAKRISATQDKSNTVVMLKGLKRM